ncbi:hypothetical protein [Syntrophotalea acetylenica]|uniref:Uncharacterized protein n=1 Tax=Syntrophotalea acetylenica TaxID=29542 RepID=A0A1L3GJ48_SYNAC|nr:hypothetical protein [Syntrophotalea acetylenica]APG25962.1 hypothetical protein A7E75_13815 [Syntrophotalea acetylenica]APG44030.1 hypothetical protein A6070_07840 [Syntrophotalea acetylenica]
MNIQSNVDFTNMSQEEIIELAKKLEKLEEENRAYRLAEELRQEEEALKEERKKESKRFLPTRNTLVLRRTPNHEVIAPTRDVLDYLNVYDLKAPLTDEGKKTKVSEEELKTYQGLVTEGVQNITVEMISESAAMKDKKEVPSSTDEEEEDSSTMEEQD